MIECLSQSAERTREIAAGIAAGIVEGEIVTLVGELGAGKTEFVRGFVQGLGYSEPISSPTFAIVNVYNTPRLRVSHFDFYRIGTIDELIEIGFEEYLCQAGSICLIEWADLFPGALGDMPGMIVRLRDGDGPGERRIITEKTMSLGRALDSV